MADTSQVSLPSHLWAALDHMSSEMGVPRDALIAQAVFTLARLNGYVLPGKVHVAAGGPPKLEPAPSRAPVPAKGRGPSPKEPEPPPPEEDKEAPEAEEEEAAAPADEGDERLPAEDEAAPEEDAEADEGDEAADEAADEDADEDADEEPEKPAPAPRGAKPVLTVTPPNGKAVKVSTEVATIGRGKSCDVVIESNRVSREHCRISREGTDFFLEDLNSSNGTFFGPGKEKVTRRKIKDGDEFTLGSEKVRFRIGH